ncbi:putative zinc finger protein [Isoptericola sp. CG 20/1183]|uniref:Zinc finger protein n=1 Tax=Isoptericola halotolerans TaxID=300560 RepID=A0ABX5EIY1_9MICO|nr:MULTISPECIES: zf-HC2 domain-containing protein [Isoptericola]PRZ08570.1 putative zinc finger protein [Isoptericola halotolerans]PRZ10983.1 putative zinc finger protein [Isoptericola sp. CG 20/1183]
MSASGSGRERAPDDGSAPRSDPAVDDAVQRLRAVAAAAGHADGPGAAGSADPDIVRTALATLPHEDQQLLWSQHVLGRGIDVVARELGLHVRAAARRLRAAEDRLGRALSAAHSRAPGRERCMETRGALHDYVTHRLGAGRRQSLEDHLFGCAGCMRAFIDVRHAAWALRDTAPLLAGGLAVAGAAGPVVIGAAGAATTHTGLLGWLGPLGAGIAAAGDWVARVLRQLFGRPVAVTAGVGVAAVAVAAVALVGGIPGGGAQDLPPPAVAGPSQASDPPQEPVIEEASPTPTPDPAPEPSPSGTPQPTPSAEPEPEPGPTVEPQPQTVWEPEPEPTPEEDLAAEPDPTTAPAAEPTRAPEPGDPEPVEPEPTTAPTSPPPSASPSPVPSSPPPVEPEPEVRTLTLTVEGIGWFRVVATDGAEIVAVETVEGYTKAEFGWNDHWRVWTANARRGTVEVTVRGAEGSAPGAVLRRWDHG